MRVFKFQQTLLMAAVLAFNANPVIANEKTVSIDKYKNQKKYFELIGQEFTVKKDNQYIINNFGVNNVLVMYHAFLISPDVYACSKSSCIRKIISDNQNFKIESIVEPSVKEGEHFGDNVCAKNVIFCYYKIAFQSNDTAYIRVLDFLDAQNPTRAYVVDPQPWKLQIIPVTPSASWKKEKKLYDQHFKKAGVSLGFTKADVLNSRWGKPQFKTKSTSYDMDIEVWTYKRGQLSIVDGYVTDVTTTN